VGSLFPATFEGIPSIQACFSTGKRIDLLVDAIKLTLFFLTPPENERIYISAFLNPFFVERPVFQFDEMDEIAFLLHL